MRTALWRKSSGEMQIRDNCFKKMEDYSQVIRECLEDIRVELTEEFDLNFSRKAFFADAWKRAAGPNPKGTLMMRTGRLRRSISSRVSADSITFTSDHPAAALHNEGGEIIVTARMKRYFWAMYYANGGGRKGSYGTGKTAANRSYKKLSRTGTTSRERQNARLSVAAYYKSLALMRVGSRIQIPRRQFIGSSPEVEKAITEIIELNLTRYFENLDVLQV